MLKSKIITGAAALTLLSGIGATAAVSPADAASPSCGSSCIDVFSHQFGDFADPGFVMDSYKQGDTAGTAVILFRTSNADPAEDFTVDNEGLTSEFYAANLVDSAVALQYGCTTTVFGACDGQGQGDYWAYEFMYSPYGVQTGLCTGVAETAVAGEKVTLQPCGVSGRTVWIAANPALESCDPVKVKGVITCTDPLYGDHGPLSQYEEALISGSDTNFSAPYGLTYPASSYPTDSPRPQLYTTNVLGFSTGAIDSDQLWSADYGVLP
jgi:hypothetical protein